MSEYKGVFRRKETKYVISRAEMEELLSLIEDNIVPDLYPESDITSTYYDTPGYEIIEHSLSKPKFKEKLRVRSYGKDVLFVELKKKYDGIVYKRRVEMIPEAVEAWMSGEMGFLEAFEAYADPAELGYRPRQIAREIDAYIKLHPDIMPSMKIYTHRFSYHEAGDSPDLRITFDTEMAYADLRNGNGEMIPLTDDVVVEMKATKAYPLWLVCALSKMHMYPRSFSKYGNAYRRVKPASSTKPAPAYGEPAVHHIQQETASARRGVFSVLASVFPKNIVRRPHKAAFAKEV